MLHKKKHLVHFYIKTHFKIYLVKKPKVIKVHINVLCIINIRARQPCIRQKFNKSYVKKFRKD